MKDFIKTSDVSKLMSLKLYFLFSHLENFPENVGVFSEGMAERFHQNLEKKDTWSLLRNDNSTN